MCGFLKNKSDKKATDYIKNKKKKLKLRSTMNQQPQQIKAIELKNYHNN
jgi:hypothetical protein